MRKEPIPSYGELFTIEEFKKHVNGGTFMNHDGIAQYSDGKDVYPEFVRPAQIRHGLINEKYSHIVWYNK